MTSSFHKPAQRHILTINLEDYFQVGPLSNVIPQRYWAHFETRVEQNTLAVLDLLDQHEIKATFFAVGWIADQLGELLAEITRRGHEVASKGYLHRSLDQMSPEEFREDVVRSRKALERACGQSVQGYRIARGWFSERDVWALDILTEEGFSYDSSFRPLGRRFASDPRQRIIHKRQAGQRMIWELPLSSWCFCGLCLPISGGNYIRQLPRAFMRWRIDRWAESAAAPLIFYFHTWELDPAQPRVEAVPWLSRVRQYRNLDTMQDRVEDCLSRYDFTSVADYLDLEVRAADVTSEPESQEVVPTKVGGERRPLTVVVPCFNESLVLPYSAKTLDSFAKDHDDRYETSFIFVDDCSTDDTWAKLQDLFGDRNDCVLIQHDRNRGITAGTMTGIRQARTELVCVIDCDCSYEIQQLNKMISLMGEDVACVTASPYHKDGSVVNVPGWRLFLSRGLSMLYRLVFRQKLATYTACFRVYRRSALIDIEIQEEGFVGIAEILAELDARGSKIAEAPAVLESRLFGRSKMKIVKTIWAHLQLLSRLLVQKRPKSQLEHMESRNEFY
jgi:polysaccharide deacetylase family protein (PEP-CTERM system associated)